jgi:hypothetical protein
VHEVSVGAGKTLRRVDWRFDETIETRPSLSLGYPDASEEREHRVLDARRLAMEIGADAIVLVSMPTADTLEAELIEIDEADSSVPIAIARLSAGAEGPIKPDLRSAARALTDRRCMDFTSPEPAALPCKGREATGAVSEATDRWPAHRRPRGQFIAGLTLVGVGVAGLATGYALLLPRRDAALNWVNEVDTGGQDASAQQKWLDLRWLRRCHSRCRSGKKHPGGRGFPGVWDWALQASRLPGGSPLRLSHRAHALLRASVPSQCAAA